MPEMGIHVQHTRPKYDNVDRVTPVESTTLTKTYPKTHYAADGRLVVTHAVWEITLYDYNGVIKQYTNSRIIDYLI